MARNIWTGKYARAEQLRASNEGRAARGVCLHRPDKPRTRQKGHKRIADTTADLAILRADLSAKRPTLHQDVLTTPIPSNPRRPAPNPEEEAMNATRKAQEESAQIKAEAERRAVEKAKGKRLDGFAALASLVGTEAIETEAVETEREKLQGRWV